MQGLTTLKPAEKLKKFFEKTMKKKVREIPEGHGICELCQGVSLIDNMWRYDGAFSACATCIERMARKVE
jgi:hypothetical protein